MASKDDNTFKDILICPICLEYFNNPKYLPCLHTFCECCIQTYITSGYKGDSKYEIECPVCRSTVPAPVTKCSPEEWAKAMPRNVLIGGLMEQEKLKQPEKVCTSCERMGMEASGAYFCRECADILCETCRKYHNANKLSADHNVRSISETEIVRDKQSALLFNCEKHKGEKIRLFCSDHELPCCSICVSIDHRKCEKVTTIKDATDNFFSTESVAELNKTLESYSKDYETLIEHGKDGLTDLEIQYDKQNKLIEDTCKEMIQKVVAFEANSKTALCKLYNEKKEIIETEIVAHENQKKKIDNELICLKTAQNTEMNVQIMLEAKKIQRSLSEKVESAMVNRCKFVIEFACPQEMNELLCKLRLGNSVTCKAVRHGLPLSILEDTLHKIIRFQPVHSGTWRIPKSSENTISFQVSKDIYLCGILPYGPRDMKPCELRFQLLDNGGQTLCNFSTIISSENAEDKIIEVKLPNKQILKKNVTYTVSLRKEDEGYFFFNYGCEGRDNVEVNGVMFNFSGGNMTRVDAGQLPGFTFQM